MDEARLSYGIPDIILPRAGGGTFNPSAFVGHELVLFFCPADSAEAVSEIDAYRDLLPDFEKGGAWVTGVLAGSEPADIGDGIAIALDPRGLARAAFESLLDALDRSPEPQAGAFLFGRGGCLTRAWPGSGHAQEVLAALRQRG